MRSIVLEDNSNSLRHWIYTLIISTYRMNRRGFDCALLRAISRCPFANSFLPLAPFPLFLFSILPRLLTHWPISSCIFLAYRSLFYSTTPRDSVENYPPKSNFYFTWLVGIPKNLQYNLPIHVFNACCTPHVNMHRICGFLVSKR